QSMLTGQKYVDFDFLPKEPARFANLSPRYPELPTTPTAMEKMSDKFEQFVGTLADLPLDKMLEDIRQALQSLREFLEAPELRGTLKKADHAMGSLGPALEDARTTLAEAQKHMDTLSSEASSTAGAARDALSEAHRALERAEHTLERVDSTAASADETRVAASEAIAELE